ncbi:DNA cytosine methyltransferase [Streptomyces sp. PR69]|uniref:DNA cytosine methyltransferase n=1 Tax=Streptomyces sp. PR69 TaxID=2984950 RepID=UPI003A5BB080
MTAAEPLVGSLLSGIGGLDLGVRRALRADVAWHVENDPHAAKILTRHWPRTPNLCDITTVDWSTVDPVCVLTAGFPCQDLSVAGPRTGLASGTRSALWRHVTDAIRTLSPCLVVIENVRGLLSTPAGTHTLRHLEPCARCMGDPSDPPRMRALGVLLADLADLGYDASWTYLRASDIGAPHRRERVFLTAWPAAAHGSAATAEDPDGEPRHQRWLPAPEPPQGPGTRPHPRRRDRTPPAYAHRQRWRQGFTEPEARQRQPYPRIDSGGPGCFGATDRGEPGTGDRPAAGPRWSGCRQQRYRPPNRCRLLAAHSDFVGRGSGGAGITPKRKGGMNLRTAVTHLPNGGAPTCPPSTDGSA